jgi:hypothetical protein
MLDWTVSYSPKEVAQMASPTCWVVTRAKAVCCREIQDRIDTATQSARRFMFRVPDGLEDTQQLLDVDFVYWARSNDRISVVGQCRPPLGSMLLVAPTFLARREKLLNALVERDLSATFALTFGEWVFTISK